MSSDSSSGKHIAQAEVVAPGKQWGPVAAIFWLLVIYLVPQVLGGLLIAIYPMLRHWGNAQRDDWLSNAVSAQFFYTVFVEAMSLGVVWLLLGKYKSSFKALGLVKARWKDVLYALIGFGVYFVGYLLLLKVATQVVPSLNIHQQQDVGFKHATGATALIMAAISLVLLPPVIEEIVFRGFLYKGLRKKMSFVIAAVITSLLFGSLHLLESADGSLLWIGGIDTFVMSMVLCYLRERTGSLVPGIGVHMLKNGLAFAVLFIFTGQ